MSLKSLIFGRAKSLSESNLFHRISLIALFAWGVRRYDLLSEEPKFQLLDEDDPPPADEDHGIHLP